MEVIQMTLKPNECIAFISDIHWDNRTPTSRIDDIMVTAYDKMLDILDKCVERNVKAVFFEGDIVNRIQGTYEILSKLIEVLLKFKENNIELYTICGNHDIVRNSLEKLDRSPLQTLFLTGIIRHINLNNRVIINKSAMITPCDYTEFPVKADKNAKTNILLAHMFYDVGSLLSDGKHDLTKKDIKELGYDVCFLGHDHERYDIVEQDGCLIVRNGSLLRGTAHNYNFTRKPSFIVVHDIDNFSKESIEEVEVKYRPYEDVASEYVLNKKKINSISGLKDVLSNLAEKLSEDSSTDGDRIMDIINTDEKLPQDCRSLILKYITELM